MRDIKDIEITLLDINEKMCEAWQNELSRLPEGLNVSVLNTSLQNFIAFHPVQAIVSPANSFGFMDGGFDLAITSIFGEELQKNVRAEIVAQFCGEQPVSSSLIVPIAATHQFLIHTPTMRYPHAIVDPEVVYHCTRNTLICAMKNDIQSIVLPAFGGCTGEIPCEEAARYMISAICQIAMAPQEINRQYYHSVRNI